LADDAELALTWQHLGAVTIGAKLPMTMAPSLTPQIKSPCISFFILSIYRLF
jgi:hypothetical protein